MAFYKKRALTPRLFGHVLCVSGLMCVGACSDRSDLITPINLHRLGAVVYTQPHFANEATVVVGIKTNYDKTLNFGIQQFSGGDGKPSMDETWHWYSGCHGLGASACRDGVSYSIFRMPPGRYALTWAFTLNKPVTFVKYRRIAETREIANGLLEGVTLFDPELRPDTPTFVARPGEVVYVGDFVLNISGASGVLSFKATPDGARAELRDIGETRPMVIRPWLAAFRSGAAHAMKEAD